MDNVDELLTRGVANIIPSKDQLKKLLENGKTLNIYLGIDPTATRIHLGHAVPLRKLQAFADLGHNVTFLIGDFTALIGDTSDKDTERPVFTPEEIEQNFQTYKKQAEKIIDFSKVKIQKNSTWLKKLTFEEIIKLCQHFSFGDFAGRELIKKRLTASKHVGLHEGMYPVMQGYDSYFMNTDIQIGGTDQTFNMQAGRILQKDLHNKESFILATEFLEGTDGRKMSKSWGNAIWLEDEPNVMFAKTMSIKDELIIQYYTLATNTSLSEIEEIKKKLDSDINPMDLKKELAHRVVTELYNQKQADEAQDYFEKTVQQKELPEEIMEISLVDAIGSGRLATDVIIAIKFAESRTEAKRLIEQGGVQIDNNKIASPNSLVYLEPGSIIKVGKRRIIRITTS